VERMARKRVVVSSSGSAFGGLTAETFAEQGAHVFVWDDDAARVGDIVRKLASRGTMVGGAVVDVRDTASVRRAAQRTVDELGGIDALINTFDADGNDTEILETDLDRWHEILSTSLLRPYVITCAVLSTMIAGGGGTVANVAPSTGVGGTRRTIMRQLATGLTDQLLSEYGARGVRARTIVAEAGAEARDEELVRRALDFTSGSRIDTGTDPLYDRRPISTS
jgi:NAD(P)-dependent dehydrogenase (short-subunit alcohol dehydrogenase family)